MKFFLVVHKDDLRLAAFVEAAQLERLCGFTILPSHGVGRQARKLDFAIGGLGAIFANSRPENATLFSIVEDDRLPRLLELLGLHLTDLDEPGGGVYAVLPVDAAGSLA